MTSLLALDFEEIRSILSLYHLDGLVSHKTLYREKLETLYWVETSQQSYFLRVCIGRAFGHMVFEKDLLKYLSQQSLPVPMIEENVASGAFTPWSVDGRYISLYRGVAGRSIGRFEFGEQHCQKVGEFLAHLHSLSDGFSSRSSAKNVVALVRFAYQSVLGNIEQHQDFARLSLELSELESELEEQECRTFIGPKGIHHGGIKISSLLFQQTELTLVRGFSGCGHDRFLFDLAKAIYDCCWIPDPASQQGPSGTYDLERINAVVRGYVDITNTPRSFWLALSEDLRLCALTSAIRRLKAFELDNEKTMVFEDYRHDISKLRALRRLGKLEPDI
ncbi:MAG: phosphotransferase [Myxococcota bacterium]|nr:phosphotransferase [Myxococcota bacterium]